MAFDGQSLWVTQAGASQMTKIRPWDGTCWEHSIWGSSLRAPARSLSTGAISGRSSGYGSVRKLRASDGVVLGLYAMAGANPALVFDGASIWSASSSNDSRGAAQFEVGRG
jgi:hypothetical protein